jgi:hypothetical protein
MNRRTFFGAVVGGTVSSRIAHGSVRNTRTSPDKFINRFTLKTKFGDYFFYWTGWKREISTVVNVGQWIAEPVPVKATDPYPELFDREHPAFYATTTGTGGALIHMNYVMDLTYQTEFPLITDKSSAEEKWDAQNEALNRLIKSIEDWELPVILYASNSHISLRDKLKPGDLIPTSQIRTPFYHYKE